MSVKPNELYLTGLKAGLIYAIIFVTPMALNKISSFIFSGSQR